MNIISAKVLFLILFTSAISLSIGQVNMVHLSGEPIILKNWLIAKDTISPGSFKIPAEEMWMPIRVVLKNSSYDTGNFLIKTEIEIPDSRENNIILGLYVRNMISAYEIYWDGLLIAKNGESGNDLSSEKSGKFLFVTPLRSDITSPGTHTIIVRISNQRNDSFWKWYYSTLAIGSDETLLSALYSSFFQSFVIMGLLFIPLLFNVFLYFARNRKTEHLLFSLICMVVFLDAATAAAPAVINLSTKYIHFQYYSYNVITLLFSILLPIFLIYFFSLSRKLILPIVLINIIVMGMTAVLVNPNSTFKIMSVALLIASTLIVLWAIKEKKENGLLILFGIIVGWIAYFMDMAFSGLAAIMVICVSFSIARQFAKSEREESEAKFKSAHLENELLKKNINPHFLLNTLTSIIAWLRKEPESAIKLVEALAQEFRMINQISSLKTITMGEEVELCRTHLQIMNYRKKSSFTLETNGLIDEEKIPPMVFHTIIENGLSHGYENKSEGIFTLKRTENENGIQYCMSNDGEYKENDNPYSTGVGFNYIKGRLQETYPGRWSLNSSQINNGYETVIEIRSK